MNLTLKSYVITLSNIKETYGRQKKTNNFLVFRFLPLGDEGTGPDFESSRDAKDGGAKSKFVPGREAMGKESEIRPGMGTHFSVLFRPLPITVFYYVFSLYIIIILYF